MATFEETVQSCRKYTANGWVCHSLSSPKDEGKSPGKSPLTPGWQLLEKTPANIEASLKNGCNLGLVCGKASGVDALDFDSDIFTDELVQGFEIKTLSSFHREGRCHLLFQHDETMFSEKHHFVGVEYFGNNAAGAGSNLVLPPSIHYTGEEYKWVDPAAPLMKMPEKLKQNLKILFAKEDELHAYFKKCRTCFTSGSKKYDNTDPRSKGLWDRPDSVSVNGTDGRQAMLSILGELKANGCPDSLLHMVCKRIMGKKYDFDVTAKELTHVEMVHPKCETLRQYVNVDCTGCQWKSQPLDTQTAEYPEASFDEIKRMHNVEVERKLNISLPEGHFITQYMRYLSTLTDAYEDYHIMSGFWILSALTQGKIVLRLKQEKLKPNLWMFFIGSSTTSRKSTAVSKARNLYETATDITLPNDDFSLEGYLETLSNSPVLNNVRDEAAGLMAKFHKKYNEGIIEMECAIYDGQNYRKTLASGGKNEPRTFHIQNPYVTHMYATTPDNLARYLTLDDFMCGYGFRFLYVCPNYKHARKPLDIESPEDILAWSATLARIRTLNQTFSTMAAETTFAVTCDAMRIFDKEVQKLEAKAEAMNNGVYDSAVGRAQAHILKIAMLIEIGKPELSLTLTPESILIASKIVSEYFLPNLMDLIDRLQEDVKFNKIEKITSVLRRLGGLATHSDVLHDAKIISREFQECIQTMIESGTIDAVKDKSSKKLYYRLIKNSPNVKQHLNGGNGNNPPDGKFTEFSQVENSQEKDGNSCTEVMKDNITDGNITDKIPQIPKILSIPLFSQVENSQEKDGNSCTEVKEVNENRDTRNAASVNDIARELENSENFGNSGNSPGQNKPVTENNSDNFSLNVQKFVQTWEKFNAQIINSTNLDRAVEGYMSSHIGSGLKSENVRAMISNIRGVVTRNNSNPAEISVSKEEGL